MVWTCPEVGIDSSFQLSLCEWTFIFPPKLTHLPSVLWHCWLGVRKNIWPVKNWVMRCWCSYLSGARCRLFAYGPTDATAIPKPHHLLSHLNPLVTRSAVATGHRVSRHLSIFCLWLQQSLHPGVLVSRGWTPSSAIQEPTTSHWTKQSTWGLIYDFLLDYLKLIVRLTYDSDLWRAKISLGNIISSFYEHNFNW